MSEPRTPWWAELPRFPELSQELSGMLVGQECGPDEGIHVTQSRGTDTPQAGLIAAEVRDVVDDKVGLGSYLHCHFGVVGGGEDPPAGEYCAVFDWRRQRHGVIEGSSAGRVERDS